MNALKPKGKMLDQKSWSTIINIWLGENCQELILIYKDEEQFNLTHIQ